MGSGVLSIFWTKKLGHCSNVPDYVVISQSPGSPWLLRFASHFCLVSCSPSVCTGGSLEGGPCFFLFACCSCHHCPAEAMKGQLIPVFSFLSGSPQTSFIGLLGGSSSSLSTPAQVSQHQLCLGPASQL